ncbi:hypothetical protein QFC21_007287 [Naganishia friedmannii]|uniref:Uncharacterized protein n=1 Tax=Naganishia friedmannii TaxID=89922 RepID=A0ACC2UVX3_9TREE|nr:hypothetical protein QFC21_007287 [Naganishia friedmannii]
MLPPLAPSMTNSTPVWSSAANSAFHTLLGTLRYWDTNPEFPVDTSSVEYQRSILADIESQNAKSLSQEVKRLIEEAASLVGSLVNKNRKESKTDGSSPKSKTNDTSSAEDLDPEEKAIRNILDRNSSYHRKLKLNLQEQERRIYEQDPAFDLAKAKQEFAELQTAFSGIFVAATTEAAGNSLLKSTTQPPVRELRCQWKGSMYPTSILHR